MAWEDFINHKCTLFHAKEGTEDLGYGVSNEHSFSYPETAEEKDTDIPCHFHVKTGSYQATYSARMKLSLPITADIRVNDKVVSGETGYTYIAEIPRKIQDHHIIVWINREGTVKEMI